MPYCRFFKARDKKSSKIELLAYKKPCVAGVRFSLLINTTCKQHFKLSNVNEVWLLFVIIFVCLSDTTIGKYTKTTRN